MSKNKKAEVIKLPKMIRLTAIALVVHYVLTGRIYPVLTIPHHIHTKTKKLILDNY